MQAWFVIEDAGEDSEALRVCSWRVNREAALEDAKARAEANHNRVYLLVAAKEGVDPVTCVGAETLCVWYPGRVSDSGKVSGGKPRVSEMRDRETDRDGLERSQSPTL
jgi:hypothetical protein